MNYAFTGMIILLGKHQFTVSSIDDSGGTSKNDAAASSAIAAAKPVDANKGGTMNRSAKDRPALAGSATSNGNALPLTSEAKILSFVENAEKLISDFNTSQSSKSDVGDISARYLLPRSPPPR